MRVKILGAPLCAGEDGDVPVRGTAGAILSLLASRPNRDVSYWIIESHCWNGSAPRTAKTAVQVAVHKLRSILEPDRQTGAEPDVLVTVADGYRLDLGPDCLDAGVFEQEMRAGRRLIADQDWDRATGHLEAALALWRGPAFGEFGDRPELMAETRRLEELRLESEELLSETHLWTGRESIPHLQALAEAEQLRERRWRHLMLALYRAGRHADALRAFTTARTALGDMGLEPSPDLYRLEEQILLHDSALLAGPPQRTTVGAQPAPEDLVGRDEDLARLVDATRPGHLVTIVGAPGVGKTSLARAFARRSTTPVAVVSLQQVDGDLADYLREAITRDHGAHPGGDSMEALAAALGGSERLLVLNDVDRHSEEAEQVIEHLLDACPSLRIIATGREPVGVAHEEVLVLGPLDVPSTQATAGEVRDSSAVGLFVREAGRRGAEMTSLADVADIVRLTDGLPAAIELAAGLVDVLDTAAIAERLRSQPGAETGGLAGAVATTLETLDDAPGSLFSLMSRFRGPLVLEEIRLAADHAGLNGDVVDHLKALVRTSILHHTRGRYSLLGPIRSEVVAAGYLGGDPAALDDAYRTAVGEIARMAAERLRTNDYATGMDMLRRRYADIRHVLLGAIDRGDMPTAWRLIGALDQYWWAIQARSEAVEMSDAVVAAGRTDVDPETLTRGLTVAGIAGFSIAAMVERLGILEEAADLGHELDPGATAALAIAFHAVAQEASQRFHPSSLPSVTEAIAIAEAAGDAFSRAYAEVAAGMIAASRLDLSHGRRACIRAAAVAESVGCDPLQAYALMWAGHIAVYADEPERARSLYEDAIALATTASLAWVVHQCRIGLAEAVQGMGDADTALELFRSAAIGLREAGDIRGAAVAAFRAAAIETELGNHDQAERLLAVAIPDLRRHGDPTIQASSIVTLAQLDLALGDRERAAAHLAEAEQLLMAGGMPPGPLTMEAMAVIRNQLAGDR